MTFRLPLQPVALVGLLAPPLLFRSTPTAGSAVLPSRIIHTHPRTLHQRRDGRSPRPRRRAVGLVQEGALGRGRQAGLKVIRSTEQLEQARVVGAAGGAHDALARGGQHRVCRKEVLRMDAAWRGGQGGRGGGDDGGGVKSGGVNGGKLKRSGVNRGWGVVNTEALQPRLCQDESVDLTNVCRSRVRRSHYSNERGLPWRGLRRRTGSAWLESERPRLKGIETRLDVAP
eukprot:scaffold24346_cov112-Isochrysis_galbana.AAC.1